jgi:hypothetical protein
VRKWLLSALVALGALLASPQSVLADNLCPLFSLLCDSNGNLDVSVKTAVGSANFATGQQPLTSTTATQIVAARTGVLVLKSRTYYETY